MTKSLILRKSRKRRKASAKLRCAINDPVLKRLWDPRKSIPENWASIPSEECLARLPTKYKTTEKKLSESDASICRRLLDRYGHKFDLMVRDTKVNRWQWGTQTLKRNIQLYEQGLYVRPA